MISLGLEASYADLADIFKGLDKDGVHTRASKPAARRQTLWTDPVDRPCGQTLRTAHADGR